ncbi:MAG: hypothetical protein ACRC62_06430 [Microcoleus sp.]
MCQNSPPTKDAVKNPVSLIVMPVRSHRNRVFVPEFTTDERCCQKPGFFDCDASSIAT